MRRSPLLLAVSLLTACNIFGKGVDTSIDLGPKPVDDEDDGPTGDDGGDEDDGGDVGGGGDGGDDGTTDDTGGTVDTFDCNQPYTKPTPVDSCVDQMLSCGQTVVGSTAGAASRWDEDAYTSWFCFPLPDGAYAGGEVVYSFQHPGTKDAVFTLDSPCEDLDIAVLRWRFWADDGECPSADTTLAFDCEADDSRGGAVLTIPEIPDGTRYEYLVIIEGPEPVDALFELSVDCI